MGVGGGKTTCVQLNSWLQQAAGTRAAINWLPAAGELCNGCPILFPPPPTTATCWVANGTGILSE